MTVAEYRVLDARDSDRAYVCTGRFLSALSLRKVCTGFYMVVLTVVLYMGTITVHKRATLSRYNPRGKTGFWEDI
jgi:hypothetical protein